MQPFCDRVFAIGGPVDHICREIRSGFLSKGERTKTIVATSITRRCAPDAFAAGCSSMIVPGRNAIEWKRMVLKAGALVLAGFVSLSSSALAEILFYNPLFTNPVNGRLFEKAFSQNTPQFQHAPAYGNVLSLRFSDPNFVFASYCGSGLDERGPNMMNSTNLAEDASSVPQTLSGISDGGDNRIDPEPHKDSREETSREGQHEPDRAVSGNESFVVTGTSRSDQEHASDPSRRNARRWQRTRRSFKLFALVTTGVVAYYQYLDQMIQTNIGRQEALFSSTASQLDSHSDAVRASALNSLFELAFTRTPIETPPGLFSPLLNFGKWLIYPPSYRNYDRCSRLFSEFAAAPRTQVQSDRDMLSYQILTIGVAWISKQSSIPELQKAVPEHWLLYRAQIPKAYVPSLNFGGIQFSDADLSHSNMSYSVFNGSDLRGSHLEGATLTGCHFINADLYGANLSHAYLFFAHLDGAQFDKATFVGTNFNNLASATGTRFNGATFTDATFTGANLSQASFKGARFVKTDFTNADLSRTDFTDADLRGSRGLNSVSSWQGAQLAHAKFPKDFRLTK